MYPQREECLFDPKTFAIIMVPNNKYFKDRRQKLIKYLI